MPPEWTLLSVTVQALRGRLDHARQDPEAGITTIEWVVIIALVVSMALAAGAAIKSRVVDKAKTLPLG